MKTVIFVRTTSIYNDSRAIKEILSLSNNGYKVIVLGWDRNGKATEKCSSLFNDNVSLYFFKCNIIKIGFRHIDKLALWFKWVYAKLILLTKRDKPGSFIIHACDLDSGLPVYLFMRKNIQLNIKLVYDVYDYYIDLHHVPHLLENMVEQIEINIVNAADVTIICTEERRVQIQKASPQKLIVIHNSPDLRSIQLPVSTSDFDYAYCGSLFPVKRLVKEILDKYPLHSELKFAFAGYGNYGELAEKLSQSCPNFMFYGTIVYQEVLKIESRTKVLSAIYDPSIRNHQLCAPNKFYESLALGKPMIVCRGTGIDKIVEAYNLGITIPYNADEFYRALYKLLKDPVRCKKMGQNGKKLYEEKYRWEIMEKKLLQAYSKL